MGALSADIFALVPPWGIACSCMGALSADIAQAKQSAEFNFKELLRSCTTAAGDAGGSASDDGAQAAAAPQK